MHMTGTHEACAGSQTAPDIQKNVPNKSTHAAHNVLCSYTTGECKGDQVPRAYGNCYLLQMLYRMLHKLLVVCEQCLAAAARQGIWVGNLLMTQQVCFLLLACIHS